MEAFYKTHAYLVEHLQSPVTRQLMNEINWTDRLIGIKGSRGVGKTTFLLQYAKECFGTDRRCLYINLNNFYFTQHRLIDFAQAFCEQGGTTLLIDQIFKYENWSVELHECFVKFPTLQVIFTGSSVMNLENDYPVLQNIVKSYSLKGFSFREYLNYHSKQSFRVYSLEEILQNHLSIASEISQKVKPSKFFSEYLHHGYYPFFLENRNFTENLLKTMNMMLEVDILLIKQIDLKYLSKIRKLLYILMENAPAGPNVSQLSIEIETSRATIMNYIKYLADARLLNLLYAEGEEFPKKPRQIYAHNTNLMHIINTGKIDKSALYKTFLYNILNTKHNVKMGTSSYDFLIDSKYEFKYGAKKGNKSNSNAYFILDEIENHTNQSEIPLWIFGFLY